MVRYLIPLIFGFACNLGSAFTSAFSRTLGKRGGSILSAVLRNVLGIPVWMIGFILSVLNPSREVFNPTRLTGVLGWLMICAGGYIVLISLATIGWRSASPSVRDELVVSGIYAHIRHPIHAGTLLEFWGLVLVSPKLSTAIACGLGTAWVFLQTWFEEIDLLERMPGYREYMNSVPRFIPRIQRQVT